MGREGAGARGGGGAGARGRGGPGGDSHLPPPPPPPAGVAFFPFFLFPSGTMVRLAGPPLREEAPGARGAQVHTRGRFLERLSESALRVPGIPAPSLHERWIE